MTADPAFLNRSGARLLRQAELLGVRRCQARGAYLNTVRAPVKSVGRRQPTVTLTGLDALQFSFQGAEPFYASQGYVRLMVIPGCFHGTVERVYMGKTPLS